MISTSDLISYAYNKISKDPSSTLDDFKANAATDNSVGQNLKALLERSVLMLHLYSINNKKKDIEISQLSSRMIELQSLLTTCLDKNKSLVDLLSELDEQYKNVAADYDSFKAKNQAAQTALQLEVNKLKSENLKLEESLLKTLSSQEKKISLSEQKKELDQKNLEIKNLKNKVEQLNNYINSLLNNKSQ